VTDLDYEAALRKTFGTLDRWLQQCALAFVPNPTSDLAEDDQDLPWLPLSQLAHLGLQSAADHLDAVRYRVESKRLFAVADLTLSRSALVGAAEAVWLLAPDDRSVRLLRARRLASYAAKHHVQYLTELLQLDPEHETTNLVLDHAVSRKAELSDRRETLGERTKLETTQMIKEAAEAVFDSALTAEVSLEWQSGSGVAHGLSWSLLGTPDTVEVGPPDSTGLTEFHAKATLGRMANSYLAAFHLATHGWRLLGLRNGRPATTADALRTEASKTSVD
jgi:hypothetical protein